MYIIQIIHKSCLGHEHHSDVQTVFVLPNGWFLSLTNEVAFNAQYEPNPGIRNTCVHGVALMLINYTQCFEYGNFAFLSLLKLLQLTLFVNKTGFTLSTNTNLQKIT